jgi:thiosulfate/3-mercaptopyruvate sulfurtransferase
MRKLIVLLVAGVMVGAATLATVAQAAQPLVCAAWVKDNIGKPGVVFLDVRGKIDYMRGHVPGALNTSLGRDGWRVRDANGVPGMLGKPDVLAKLIGGFGIDNLTHVVLVPWGYSSGDMGTATRIYWTFKVLGHDAVSIVNGGMAAYTDVAGNPLEKGRMKTKPTAKTFTVNLRADMIATKNDVKMALKKGTPLVDNRAGSQYLGVTQSGATARPGTLPGAKNLPQDWLTENGGGEFRDKSVLAKLFELAGLPTEGDQITFCNTGYMASVGWFAASEVLGNKKVKMYDGSMAEWTADEDLPVQSAVSLE